jgi:MATE family multidrug resistance protein
MCLTLGFSFFGNAAAAQGIIFLASYHILMQFITIIALVLDAFAHTAEAFVGAAYGAKNLQNFDRSVKLTTNFSIIFAFMLSFIIFIFGPSAIEILSTDENVISTANRYLPYCALTPVIGFAAWQLDGVFIGTTSTREMRNAGILAVIIYILAHYLITLKLEKDGIWISFLIYYLARAFTLSYYYPSVRKRIYSSS